MAGCGCRVGTVGGGVQRTIGRSPCALVRCVVCLYPCHARSAVCSLEVKMRRMNVTFISTLAADRSPRVSGPRTSSGPTAHRASRTRTPHVRDDRQIEPRLAPQCAHVHSAARHAHSTHSGDAQPRPHAAKRAVAAADEKDLHHCITATTRVMMPAAPGGQSVRRPCSRVSRSRDPRRTADSERCRRSRQ